jgi:hypothetical protein
LPTEYSDGADTYARGEETVDTEETYSGPVLPGGQGNGVHNNDNEEVVEGTPHDQKQALHASDGCITTVPESGAHGRKRRDGPNWSKGAVSYFLRFPDVPGKLDAGKAISLGDMYVFVYVCMYVFMWCVYVYM